MPFSVPPIPKPATASRRGAPPHRPGRGRQAPPRWYSFTPPQWHVFSPPLTHWSDGRDGPCRHGDFVGLPSQGQGVALFILENTRGPASGGMRIPATSRHQRWASALRWGRPPALVRSLCTARHAQVSAPARIGDETPVLRVFQEAKRGCSGSGPATAGGQLSMTR